jgi:hypothetical protein
MVKVGELQSNFESKVLCDAGCSVRGKEAGCAKACWFLSWWAVERWFVEAEKADSVLTPLLY